MTDTKVLANYILSLSHAKKLFDQGLISLGEYDNFDTILRQKYGIFEGSLFRINP